MKTTAKPPLERHQTHSVEIRKGSGNHSAQFYCIECEKHVSWLSKTDTEIAIKLGLLCYQYK
jgi:hypothetical protein